jgi:hypothetical protein
MNALTATRESADSRALAHVQHLARRICDTEDPDTRARLVIAHKCALQSYYRAQALPKTWAELGKRTVTGLVAAAVIIVCLGVGGLLLTGLLNWAGRTYQSIAACPTHVTRTMPDGRVIADYCESWSVGR